MAQRDEGTLVLPPVSPRTPLDAFAMCAAPALVQAASIQRDKSPFRTVAIVSAQELGADSGGAREAWMERSRANWAEL